jgi:7-carboxy-7-deazaguanine synthase (Cx14CxxC type)
MNGEHGGMFQSTDRLVEEMRLLWAENTGETSVTPFVILTGGEPGLQVDAPLIHRLHQTGFEVAIETNGTLDLPLGIDWICVSPKSGTQLRMQRGNEIKIVFPQENLDPRDFECLAFDYFFLQPRHAPEYEENLRQTIAYCIMNPRWRLSLQTHKLIGIR